MALDEDYIDALGALARVSARYEAETGGHLVLVGGGATAVLTDGAFPSFDFDVVAAADDVLARTFGAEGFIREHRTGVVLRGYYHPDHPRYGFEHVSGALFDGHAEPGRLERFAIVSQGHIVVPSWEDMIADRLAQHEIGSPTDDSRLRQAHMLFRLAERIDHVYLWRRICDEGGDPALLPSSLTDRT